MAAPEIPIDVASAIADGAAIDWPALVVDGDDESRQLAARLRHVERLVRAHDALRARDSSAGASTSELTLLSEARVAAGPSSGPLEVRWGPLVVVERIGRGSFGDVYRAWDPHVEREVALKLMPDKGTGPRSVAIDEARRLARVEHPNVLTVYGAERIDGRVGIWTKFVRGGTLEDEIRERGPLTVADTIRVGVDIARALAAVHAAGLLHRDVKAHNVMRDGGHAVLSDFGTSVEFDEQAGVTDPRIAGTPLYLAPEVLAGRPPSIASDLYSLGVLLYHAATGDYPIRGATLREIRRAHEQHARVELNLARPGLPAAFVGMVEQLLSRDPEGRFADAASVAAALSGLSRPAGPRAIPWRVVAVVGTLSAAAVAAVFWPWAAASRSDGPRGDWTTRQILDAACVGGSLAPDGRLACRTPAGVVVFHPDTGNAETVVVQAEGASTVVDVVFSPDGSSLAYMVAPNPNVRNPSGPLVERSLRLRDLATGDDRLLAALPGDALLLALRNWHRATGLLEFYVRHANDSYALMQMDPASAEMWTVFEFPSMPQGHATSPDGRFLAFDFQPSAQVARDVQVCDLVDRGCLVVSPHPADDFRPFWTHDGRLLFSSTRSGSYGLYSASIAGLRETQAPDLVADFGRQHIWPVGFSGAGEFYYVKVNPAEDVYTLALAEGADATTTAPVAIPTSPGWNRSAAWSPDGTMVAYVQQRGPFTDPGSTGLVVQSLSDGSSRRFSLELRPQTTGLAWSPNSRRLALRGVVGDPARNPRPGIHIIDAVDGQALKYWPVVGQHVTWLDETSLGFTAQNRVSVLDLETGEIRTAWSAPAGSILQELALSPDRRSMAVVLRSEEPARSRLGVIAVGSPSLREIMSDARRIQLHDWTADGQSLLVGLPDRGSDDVTRAQLWGVRAEDGQATPMTLPLRGLMDVRAHRDGRQISFTLSNRLRELWVARGLPR